MINNVFRVNKRNAFDAMLFAINQISNEIDSSSGINTVINVEESFSINLETVDNHKVRIVFIRDLESGFDESQISAVLYQNEFNLSDFTFTKGFESTTNSMLKEKMRKLLSNGKISFS